MLGREDRPGFQTNVTSSAPTSGPYDAGMTTTNLISRRAALLSGAGTAAGAAALLLESPDRAGAALRPSGSPDHSESAGIPEGVTDLAGVQAEYAETVQRWPFALPDGFVMPPVSRLSDGGGARSYWSHGSGVAEAYLYWSEATAGAAYAAYRTGAEGLSGEHLDALVSVYDSQLVRSVIDDPERNYVRGVVEPAQLHRNYGPLVEFYQLEPNDTPTTI